MRITYLVVTAIALSALTAVDAKAGNSASVLQFGTTNSSFQTR